MSDGKRKPEDDSHEVKRYRREEMEQVEQNESDDSDYQPYIPLRERRKEKGDQMQVKPQESRRLSVQNCIQELLHACKCRDANCSLPHCRKRKRDVLHARTKSIADNCLICKELWELGSYHAKTCREAKCPIPFCVEYRRRIPKILNVLKTVQQVRETSDVRLLQLNQRVMAILKSNKQLMKAFIKHKVQMNKQGNMLDQQPQQQESSPGQSNASPQQAQPQLQQHL